MVFNWNTLYSGRGHSPQLHQKKAPDRKATLSIGGFHPPDPPEGGIAKLAQLAVRLFCKQKVSSSNLEFGFPLSE